jgi:hypothetical protein
MHLFQKHFISEPERAEQSKVIRQQLTRAVSPRFHLRKVLLENVLVRCSRVSGIERDTSHPCSTLTRGRLKMRSWTLSSSTAGVTRSGRGPHSPAWIVSPLLGSWVTVRPQWPPATTSMSQRPTSQLDSESLWSTRRATLPRGSPPHSRRQAKRFNRFLRFVVHKAVYRVVETGCNSVTVLAT